MLNETDRSEHRPPAIAASRSPQRRWRRDSAGNPRRTSPMEGRRGRRRRNPPGSQRRRGRSTRALAGGDRHRDARCRVPDARPAAARVADRYVAAADDVLRRGRGRPPVTPGSILLVGRTRRGMGSAMANQQSCCRRVAGFVTQSNALRPATEHHLPRGGAAEIVSSVLEGLT